MNWQVTVTTLHCNYVDEYVTIMVRSDLTAECVFWKRYIRDKEKLWDKKRAKKAKNCIGPLCPIVAGYRDKLQQEEMVKP